MVYSVLKSVRLTYQIIVHSCVIAIIIKEIEVPPGPDPINGWVPDSNLPCYGLPGAIAPTGYFDPLGFAQTGISLNDVKRFRRN